jgi:alanine racemase
MLYGVSPFADRVGRDLGLRPVMALHSELIAVQACRAGDRVGYGLRYRCARDTRIGVVAIGYGDGYPRHAADGTPLQVAGDPATLAGVASMDMLTVDLGPDSEARPGDAVELWGDRVPVEAVARHAGTIPYELLCQLTARVPLRQV